MKLRTLLNEITRKPIAATMAAAAGLAMTTAPATAQDYYDEHYEWEAGEGYHEEEWYDPSDWFDDEFNERAVDYESDWWDTNGYYDDYGYNDYWYDDYDYGDYGYDYYDDYDYGDYGYDYYDNYGYDYGGYDYYDDYGGYDDYDLDYDVYSDSRSRQNSQMQQGQRNQQDQRQRYNAQQNQRQTAQRGDSSMRQARNAELRGQLEDWSRVNLQGQREAHTLVRLRLENGRSAVVNLGPNVSLSRLNLDRGDAIAVYGSRGAINGRDVLMADKVRTEDKVITMNQWEPSQRQANTSNQRRMEAQKQRRTQTGQRPADQRQAGAQRLILRGELEDAKRVNLQGQRDANTLVRVRLENGRSAVVNLGPNVSLATLADMDISMGDQVAVWGHRRQMGDRSIIVAERVQAGDQTKTLNWQGQNQRTSQR